MGRNGGGEKRGRGRVIADGGGSRYQIESVASTRERERERDPEERRRHIVGRRKEPVAGRDVLVGEHSVQHIATTPIDCSDCLHSMDKGPARSQTKERRAFQQIPAAGRSQNRLPFQRVSASISIDKRACRKTSIFHLSAKDAIAWSYLK